jgi:hypothetical protein
MSAEFNASAVPKLLAVRYRLLEGEEAAALAAAMNETHDFGGEIVLSLQGTSELFISWVNEPVQHCIGTGTTSHFIPDAALTEYDVSATSMWSGLVGQDVSMEFLDPYNQMLAISSSKDRLLLCSFERGSWWADEVTVCREAPAPYGV